MTKLPFIHYSNPSYQGGKEQIVYGSKSPELQWNYSDRLIDWSYNTKKEEGQSDIDYWENILFQALRKKVKIECVIGGCNQSNGFGYYVFGYRAAENNELAS